MMKTLCADTCLLAPMHFDILLELSLSLIILSIIGISKSSNCRNDDALDWMLSTVCVAVLDHEALSHSRQLGIAGTSTNSHYPVYPSIKSFSGVRLPRRSL